MTLHKKFLHRISKVKVHRRYSALEKPSLYPSQGDTASPSRQANTNLAHLEDLSYEDALLDSQMRLYFRSEWGQAEPDDPSQCFYNVVARTEHESVPLTLRTPRREAKVGLIRRPAAEGFQSRHPRLVSLYQALTGAFTMRVVPGGLALLLMLTFLGANPTHFFKDDVRFLEEASAPAVSASSSVSTASAPGTAPGTVPNVLPTQPPYRMDMSQSSAEWAVLHPVELGLKPGQRPAHDPTRSQSPREQPPVKFVPQ